jgi:hypothetical protein
MVEEEGDFLSFEEGIYFFRGFLDVHSVDHRACIECDVSLLL